MEKDESGDVGHGLGGRGSTVGAGRSGDEERQTEASDEGTADESSVGRGPQGAGLSQPTASDSGPRDERSQVDSEHWSDHFGDPWTKPWAAVLKRETEALSWTCHRDEARATRRRKGPADVDELFREAKFQENQTQVRRAAYAVVRFSDSCGPAQLDSGSTDNLVSLSFLDAMGGQMLPRTGPPILHSDGQSYLDVVGSTALIVSVGQSARLPLVFQVLGSTGKDCVLGAFGMQLLGIAPAPCWRKLAYLPAAAASTASTPLYATWQEASAVADSLNSTAATALH